MINFEDKEQEVKDSSPKDESAFKEERQKSETTEASEEKDTSDIKDEEKSNPEDFVEETKETSEETNDKGEEEDPTSSEEVMEDTKDPEDERMFFNRKRKKLEEEIKRLKNENSALTDRLSRLVAEYDNYRKRTAKEKEEISNDCTAKVIADILPGIDNLERALVTETDDLPGLKEGVQMTLDQFFNALKKLQVEEIPTTEGFDPNFHEAVMHETDENRGEKEISEVFIKGYRRGDKVIRHSIVKVVN